MTGIFSEVETEMGQERENTGKEGEERQGVPVGPGALAILSGLRGSQGSLLRQWAKASSYTGATLCGDMGSTPKPSGSHRDRQHGLRGWWLGCASLVRRGVGVGRRRGNGF